MQELWDAYDSSLHRIPGVVLKRGEPVPEGMYHLVCNVVVQHADGTYLLMQRHPDKHFGGMWEATAGGSALQGETPTECAKRELREETGLECCHLVRLGETVDSKERTIYIDFSCTTDCSKDGVQMQEAETVAYRWAIKDEILAMDADGLVTRRCADVLRRPFV